MAEETTFSPWILVKDDTTEEITNPELEIKSEGVRKKLEFILTTLECDYFKTPPLFISYNFKNEGKLTITLKVICCNPHRDNLEKEIRKTFPEAIIINEKEKENKVK